MSRIGKQPIAIKPGVTITVDDKAVTVKGPKGELSQSLMPGIDVKVEGENVLVTRISDEKVHRSKHGLMRTLVSNMVVGVTDGFEKKLEVNGVGYRVSQAGTNVRFIQDFHTKLNTHCRQESKPKQNR